jgi:hypothetical protein
MPDDKRAAIDLDAIGDRQLGDITASELLDALDAGGLDALSHMPVMPEKKKVELEVDTPTWSKVRVKDLFRVIRVEKKKAELEKLPGFEAVLKPGAEAINPPMDRVLQRLDEIEKRLPG